MRVYLAGPMSGIRAFNIPAFDEAARNLRDAGYEVFSPAEIDGPITRAVLLKSATGDHKDLPMDESYSYYLSRDFRILCDSGIEKIVTLPGWKDSKGARLEVALAKELGIAQCEYFDLIFAIWPNGAPDVEKKVGEDEGLYVDGQFVPYVDNPLRQRSAHGGVKDDLGKSRVDLIPPDPLVEIGKVLEYGARKYKPNNWRLGLPWSATMASLLRHLYAFQDGEDLDPETSLPHLAHAGCQLLFLTEYFLNATGTDDRWSSVDHAEAIA